MEQKWQLNEDFIFIPRTSIEMYGKDGGNTVVTCKWVVMGPWLWLQFDILKII